MLNIWFFKKKSIILQCFLILTVYIKFEVVTFLLFYYEEL
jgi:hypothetical protein